MCAWIFKGGILNNAPALTCCCVFFLNKWTCFIFTRSLLLRCMNQNYTWSPAGFGSLPLHKYHLYAPTLCCSVLCWLALAHRGTSIDFQKAFMLATTAHRNRIFSNWPSVSHCMAHPIFSDLCFCCCICLLSLASHILFYLNDFKSKMNSYNINGAVTASLTLSIWTSLFGLLWFLSFILFVCVHSMLIAFIYVWPKKQKGVSETSMAKIYSVCVVASVGESVLARLFLKAECMTTTAKGRRGHDHSSFIDRGQM